MIGVDEANKEGSGVGWADSLTKDVEIAKLGVLKTEAEHEFCSDGADNPAVGQEDTQAHKIGFPDPGGQ